MDTNTIDYCPQCCRPVPIDESYCDTCGYCLGCDFDYPRRQEAAPELQPLVDAIPDTPRIGE